MPTPSPAVEQYTQIRSKLKTGDILAFSNDSALDWMIKLLEDGDYTHVGMVLRDEQDRLWFWDAPGGGLTFPDPWWEQSRYYVPGTQNLGCRVADLDTLLCYYMSSIKTFTWRPLSTALPYSAGSGLESFVKATDGTPFPGQTCELPTWLKDLVEQKYGQAGLESATLGLGLLLTYFTGSILLVPTAGYMFCAQLLAQTYMNSGLLPVSPLPANGYTPAAFLDQPVPLKLLEGFTLGEPVPVNFDLNCAQAALLGGAPGHAPAADLIPALVASLQQG